MARLLRVKIAVSKPADCGNCRFRLTQIAGASTLAARDKCQTCDCWRTPSEADKPAAIR